jgi:membrane protease YdiL (CAAX protease family)
MDEYYRVTDLRTRVESLGHSLGVVVGAFLLGYVLLNVAALVLVAAGVVSAEALASADISVPANVYAVTTIAQFAGFVVIALTYVWWRDEFDLFAIDLPDLRDLGAMAGGFVTLFVAALSVSYVVQQLGADTATNQVVEQGQQNPTLFLYMIPITILVVAPAEELLFRGVVQGLFRRAYGLVPGILLASALFGVAHWLALTGAGRLTYIAIAAVLGLVLGTVYELTENLAVPIVIHGLWNAFLFGSQYYDAVGVATAMV